MDVTPFINIASMGGLGYLSGMLLKTNPQMFALVALVSEVAVQSIKYLKVLDDTKNEQHLRLVVGSIACVYLDQKHFMTKLVHALLSICTFCFVPDLIERSRISFVIGKK